MKIGMIFIIPLLFILLISVKDVSADSGWDTDYDSGSSWDSDYDSSWDNVFEDCGTDGTLTKVVVSSDNIKNKIEQLTSPSDIPQFWKDNNIVQVQSNRKFLE